MRPLSLPGQIVLGFIAGTVWSMLHPALGLEAFTTAWIAPLGTLFLNLLKLVAVPLVVASLVEGIATVGNLGRLSRLGMRTMAYYLASTIVAVLIGIGIATALRPGAVISPEQQATFRQQFERSLAERQATAAEVQQKSPLQVLVELVPDNVFATAQDNRRMLSLIILALSCSCSPAWDSRRKVWRSSWG